MEDIIRRTKENRRQACLEERERRLRNTGYETLSTPEGKYCFYSFGELLHLPAAVAYLRADGLDRTLSEANREVITNKILKLGALRKREIEEKIESRLMEALAEHDLLPFDFKLPENHQNMMEYKCAFFAIKGLNLNCRTFENLLALYEWETLFTYRANNRRLGIYEKLLEEHVPNIEACAVALKLTRAVGVGDLTMRELDALGDVFDCNLCSVRSQKYKWSALVRARSIRSQKPCTNTIDA